MKVIMEQLNLKHWAVKHAWCLRGYRCDVYSDHEANTLQPLGRLARWGLALQKFDARIHHRLGKANNDADTLSQNTN